VALWQNKNYLAMTKQWYESLFENYANTYEKEVFTQGTLQEVSFIEQEIFSDKTKHILDVGCGTGRHSIELARRGYQVTGFDLSNDQLKKARENAVQANVQVEFFKQDACNFNFHEKYDAALMLCEGSFPLMETDEMNFAILQNIHHSIKPGGKIIFTTLNGLFPLFHSVKDFLNENMVTGTTEPISFDLMTFRDHNEYSIPDDDGNPRKLICNERYYVPSEITWLLKSIGYKHIEIFGCTVGEFSREVALTTEHYEMLVIAEKP
jgi:2-polyprenyl-3-methyl-5-hydroxy-6-metoxy-1,4-benzoquinol methylase